MSKRKSTNPQPETETGKNIVLLPDSIKSEITNLKNQLQALESNYLKEKTILNKAYNLIIKTAISLSDIEPEEDSKIMLDENLNINIIENVAQTSDKT